MEEVGYQWGAEEDDAIEEQAQNQVDNERCVIIIIRGIRFADECRSEAGIDERLTDIRKDQDNAQQSVVVRGEQSCQYDADHKRRSHLHDIVNAAPGYALDSFIF